MAIAFQNLKLISLVGMIVVAFAVLGCKQQRYQPSEWRSLKRNTTLPGTTLPGTTLPGTTLPGTTLPGTTLPGTTLPGTTLPGTTLPGGWRPSRAPNRLWSPNFDPLPGTTLPGTTLPGNRRR